MDENGAIQKPAQNPSVENEHEMRSRGSFIKARFFELEKHEQDAYDEECWKSTRRRATVVEATRPRNNVLSLTSTL
jgi:hypothetical protein